jgi:hypothetical protein
MWNICRRAAIALGGERSLRRLVGAVRDRNAQTASRYCKSFDSYCDDRHLGRICGMGMCCSARTQRVDSPHVGRGQRSGGSTECAKTVRDGTQRPLSDHRLQSECEWPRRSARRMAFKGCGYLVFWRPSLRDRRKGLVISCDSTPQGRRFLSRSQSGRAARAVSPH